jgi:hypothetical protein
MPSGNPEHEAVGTPKLEEIEEDIGDASAKSDLGFKAEPPVAEDYFASLEDNRLVNQA